MRISKDQKLEIVRKHLNDGITLRELSEEYGMDQSMLKYNVALYLRHGEGAFTDQSERTVHCIESGQCSFILVMVYTLFVF